MHQLYVTTGKVQQLEAAHKTSQIIRYTDVMKI